MAAGCGAGVPAAGVLGAESDAFSALELAAAGSVVDVAGDDLPSFTGDSSLTEAGSTIRRSFPGDVLRVTMRLSLDGAAVDAVAAGVDFRRSLAAAVFLPADAMMEIEKHR